MKIRIRNIFTCIASLVVVNGATAQENPVITGTFTEKVNAELQLFRTVNNKLQRLGEYSINPSNPEFVFALSSDTAITYSFQITIMKQGHMRLEADKWFTLPLTLKPGQNYSLKVIPSKLDAAKKTGWELKTDERKSSIAFVSGKLVNWNLGANVFIQRVVDGGLEKINGISNSKENTFLLPCAVKKEGFYYLNSPRWILRVYLKPADKLELAIDGKSGSYEVINGSEENRLMQNWQHLISPITNYGYNSKINQKDSFDLNNYQKIYEELEPSIVNFRNNINHSDSRFSKLFEMAIDMDKELAPILFLFNSSAKKINGFRIMPKNFNDVPDFYNRFIQPQKFNDAKILELGEAMSFINLYQKLNLAFIPGSERKILWRGDKMKIMMDVITNDTVKAHFLKEQMETNEVNNLSEFRSIYAPFEKYTFPSTVKKKYREIYESFIGDTAFIGKSAYNFSLPDTSGKVVSMKDFSGKVVFIDVWATWCGPCRGQFPYLKEIEEEYKDNQNIVFLGISLDKLKDRQKWLKLIQKERLPGLQLLDDFGKSFGQKYGISAIPRFLLIDKQGKWIEIRCPKPEAKEELKKYLDDALGENSLTQNQ